MTLVPALALAALTAATPVGLPAPQPAAPTQAAGAADDALPGVDLAGLAPEQRALILAWARETFCYCGCPHTVAQCLREHASCKHAARMATLAVRLARAGAKGDDLGRAVASYYASFDRRAKLDVSQFGPPLGSASAKVALVEFSDFTCPYCQMVRPGLEAFVKARADRVKLFYKPFPIESHPGALACSQAGEWARDKGLFWRMHDAIFGDPAAHTPEALAALATEVGGDAAELRAAIADGRFVPKIRASQEEAKKAGIKGTPTLFMNGRMLVLGDVSEEGLEFTLQDEEEWVQHHGWQRD